MRTRRGATIQELRLAIDSLPRDTRIAMLEGVRSNDIIAGAYSAHGGICPMLAAHRAGGRTTCIAFARAWDRFAFADVRRARARRATRRELLVLTSHLRASLLEERGPAPDLSTAIREHRELVANRPDRDRPHQARPGDAYRSPELRQRPGWAWLRVMRRYDEYERALTALRTEPAVADRAGEPQPSG
jgi:hypothetical protein